MNIIELKSLARETVSGLALSSLENPIQIDTAEYAVDSGVKDDKGNPIFVSVKFTAKNTTATKVSPAFDVQLAHDTYVNNRHEASEKAKAKAEITSSKANADKERRAKSAEKTSNYLQLIKTYMQDVLADAPQRASEIKEAIPELADETIMYVGTLMKKAVESGFANLVIVDKANCYHG